MCPLKLDEVETYDDLTHKQWIALGGKVGGLDAVKEVLREEKEILLRVPEIKLFDKNGRRIPLKGLRNRVHNSLGFYNLGWPKLNIMSDHTERLIRWQQVFRASTPEAPFDGRMLENCFLSFESRIKALIDEISANKSIVNLLNGAYFPIVLPRIGTKINCGAIMENYFFAAIERSYEKQFLNRKFYNRRKGELFGRVSIVDSRHKQFVERMKKEFVYAIYFPNPLQGFSVLAAREQMKDLPESLILAGGFDTATALVMYPDILCRDECTPGYDLSAFQWSHSSYSFRFKAYASELVFNAISGLGDADGSFSSGLTFLGSTS